MVDTNVMLTSRAEPDPLGLCLAFVAATLGLIRPRKR